MNGPSRSQNKQGATSVSAVSSSARRVAGTRLSYLAGLLLIPGLAAAQSTCPDSGNYGVFVQYKAAIGYGSKCGFEQLLSPAPDAPRYHLYHQQVVSQTYHVYQASSGSSSETNTVTQNCSGGTTFTIDYYPGSFFDLTEE